MQDDPDDFSWLKSSLEQDASGIKAQKDEQDDFSWIGGSSSPDTTKKAEDLGAGDFYSQGADMFMSGVGSLASRLGGALRWVGRPEDIAIGESLKYTGKEIEKDNTYISAIQDFEWGDLTTAKGWANLPRLAFEGALTSAPEMLLTMPIGGVTGIAARSAGKAVFSKIAPKIVYKITAYGANKTLGAKAVNAMLDKATFQGGAQSAVTGALEGGSVYNELVNSGVSPEEASKQAFEVFTDNLALTIINAPQFGYLFPKGGPKAGAKKLMSKAGDYLKMGAGEAGEETYQQASSSSAIDRGVGLSEDSAIGRFTDFDFLTSKQAAQSAISGFASGMATKGGVDAVGTGYQSTKKLIFGKKQDEPSIEFTIDDSLPTFEQLNQVQSELLRIQALRKEASDLGQSTENYDQAIESVLNIRNDIKTKSEFEDVVNAELYAKVSPENRAKIEKLTEEIQKADADRSFEIEAELNTIPEYKEALDRINSFNPIEARAYLDNKVNSKAKQKEYGEIDFSKEDILYTQQGVFNKLKTELNALNSIENPTDDQIADLMLKRGELYELKNKFSSDRAASVADDIRNDPKLTETKKQALILKLKKEHPSQFKESDGQNDERDAIPETREEEAAAVEPKKPKEPSRVQNVPRSVAEPIEQIQPIGKVEENLGTRVDYNGYTGTLSREADGTLVVDTGKEVVEIPDAKDAKDSDLSELGISISPIQKTIGKVNEDGTVSIIDLDKDSEQTEKVYSSISRFNENENGDIESVVLMDQTGGEVVVDEPSVITTLYMQDFESKVNQRINDEADALTKTDAESAIDGVYTSDDIAKEAAGEILDTLDKGINDIFDRLERNEPVTQADLDYAEGFISDKLEQIKDKPEAVQNKVIELLDLFRGEISGKIKPESKAETVSTKPTETQDSSAKPGKKPRQSEIADEFYFDKSRNKTYVVDSIRPDGFVRLVDVDSNEQRLVKKSVFDGFEIVGQTPTKPKPVEETPKPIEKPAPIKSKVKGADGRADTVIKPNGKQVKGRYRLINANDAKPSHDPFTFNQTEGFPTTQDGKTVNDRDYKNDTRAQEAVVTRGSNFDARALQGTLPVMTPDGLMVSGNDRTMSRQRSAKQGTDKAYIQALKEKAAMYGFTPEQIDAMENPYLVFETDEKPDMNTTEFASWNEDGGKGMSPLDEAIKMSKTIPDKVKRLIYGAIDGTQTMSEITSDPKKVSEIASILVKNGVIRSDRSVIYFTDKNTVTDNGVTFLENLLIGSVFSEDIVRYMGSNNLGDIKNKLISALVPLLQNATMSKDSLMSSMLDAIKIIKGMKTSGLNMYDYITNQDAFSDVNLTLETLALAIALDSAGFAKFVRNYNNEVSSEGMFDEPGVDKKTNYLSEIFTIKGQDNVKKALEFIQSTPKGEQKPIQQDSRSVGPKELSAETTLDEIKNNLKVDKEEYLIGGRTLVATKTEQGVQIKWVDGKEVLATWSENAKGEMVQGEFKKPKAESKPKVEKPKSEPKPKTSNQTAIEKSKQKMADLMKQFGKQSGGQLNAGLDPKSIKIATQFIAEGTKLGYLQFKEFVGFIQENLGEDFLRQIFDAFKDAYTFIKNLEGNKNREDLTSIRKLTVDEAISQYKNTLVTVKENLIKQDVSLQEIDHATNIEQAITNELEPIVESLETQGEPDGTESDFPTNGPDDNPTRVPTPQGELRDGRESKPRRESGNRNVSERPKLVTYNQELIPKVKTTSVSSSDYNGYPDEYQVTGINMAVDRVLSGGKGFVLGDGTGVGKTVQVLGIADQLSKKGKVLIVTENRQQIAKNYKNNSKDVVAMGIDIEGNSNIEIVTYNDVSSGKVKSEYYAVLYDEAHNLKNEGSGKTIGAENIKKQSEIFVTATPSDKISGMAYFLHKILDVDIDEIYNRIGLSVRYQKDEETGTLKRVVEIAQGTVVSEIQKNLVKIRNVAIQQGGYLRREFPFYGEIYDLDIPMDEDFSNAESQINEYWDDRLEEKMGDNGSVNPRVRMNIEGQRAGELDRFGEISKVKLAFNYLKKSLSEGKSVILLAETINDLTFKGLDSLVQKGAIGALRDLLKGANIPFVEISGNMSETERTKANKDFQSGAVKVLIGTKESASTGIDLDDQVGNMPRRLILLTPPYAGDKYNQILGRVSRKNTMSPAEVVLILTNTQRDFRRKQIMDRKRATLKAIQEGKIDDEVELDFDGNNTTVSTAGPTTKTLGNFVFTDISDKAFVVKSSKEDGAILKQLGGKWMPKHNGWMFPKVRQAEVSSGIDNAKKVKNYTGSLYDNEAVARVQQRQESKTTAGVDSPVNLAETISALAKTLGMTIRQGRILGRAQGTYNLLSGVTRVKKVYDIDVIAHEGGHQLQQKLGKALDDMLAKYADSLAIFSEGVVVPKGQEISEGFAEFFAAYILNPEYAKKIDSKLFAEFESFLDKKLLEQFHSVQDAYTLYVSQSASQKAQSEIVSARNNELTLANAIRDNSFTDWLGTHKRIAYSTIIDKLNPVNKLREKLKALYREKFGEAIDLEVAEDPYKLFRLASDAYSDGNQWIEYGVREYQGLNIVSSSMKDALHLAMDGEWTKDKMTELGSYLASRRLIHEWKRYLDGDLPKMPSKSSLNTHVQNVQELEAKYPKFKESAELFYEFNQALWKLKYDAGLISRKVYNKGVDSHPDYVPLQRDVSDKVKVKQLGAGDNVASIAKTFRGSDRNIINPLETMMQDAYATAHAIKKNESIKAMHNLARSVGDGAGKYIEQVPSFEFERVAIKTEDAIASLTRSDDWDNLDDRDAFASSLDAIAGNLPMTVSGSRITIAGKRAEPIVYYWDNGERIALRIGDDILGKEVYDAITGLDKETSGKVLEIVSKGAMALRVGITTDPSFAIANVIKDQISAWILTDTNLPRQVVNTIKGFKSELSQDEFARAYRSFSGMSTQNVSAIDRSKANNELMRLKDSNYVIRRFKSWKAMAEIMDLSEIGTRIGVMRNYYDKAKKRGLSDHDAMMEAAYASRDYIDFGRNGNSMMAARKLVTFLNAALQGLDKASRVLSADEIGEGRLKRIVATYFHLTSKSGITPLSDLEKKELARSARAWVKLVTIGVIGGALAALHGDDEEYDEISREVKATHWVVKGTDGEYIVVPKPYELAVVSNAIESALEYSYTQDPNVKDRWLKGLKTILTPPTVPNILGVSMEVWGNKRVYDGMPIVSPTKLGYDADRQFNNYTSELAKKIGKGLDLSPAKVDHVVGGIFGTWGRTAMQAGSSFIPIEGKGEKPENNLEDSFISRRFVKRISRGSFSEKQFWANMQRVDGRITSGLNTWKDLLASNEPGRAMEYFKNLDQDQKLYVISKAIGKQIGLDKHPLDRANKVGGIITNLRDEVYSSKFISGEMKRKLDNELDMLATIEYRNSLISAGVSGHENRKLLDFDGAMEKLQSISPDVTKRLDRMLRDANVRPDSEKELERFQKRSKMRMADLEKLMERATKDNYRDVLRSLRDAL